MNIERINDLFNNIKKKYQEDNCNLMIKTSDDNLVEVKNFYKIIIDLLENFEKDEFIFYPILNKENQIVFPVFRIDENVNIEKFISVDIITGEIIGENLVYDKKNYSLSEDKIASENIYDEFSQTRNKIIEDMKNDTIILTYYSSLKKLLDNEELVKDLIGDIELEDNSEEIEASVKQQEKNNTDSENLEWNPVNGINLIEDKILDLALKLEKNFNVDYEFSKNDKDENVVIIRSNVLLCNLFESKKEDIYNNLFTDFDKHKDEIDLSGSKMTRILERGIGECTESAISKCPVIVAGYIKYLRDVNKLELRLKEREEYRAKEKINTYFDFFWEPKEGLKNIPQDEFNLAYHLVKKGLITVDSFLTNGKVVMRDFPSCSTLVHLENYTKSTSTLIRQLDSIGLCNAKTCNRQTCILSVAGYIYYLLKSGNKSKIIEDRQYYKENEETILYKYNQKKPKFKFDFEIKNGLDELSDEKLEESEKLLDELVFELEPQIFRDEKNTPFFRYRYINELCGGQNRVWTRDFRTNYAYDNIVKRCGDVQCKYEFCPLIVCGYIYYLKYKGLYSEFKEKRRIARANLSSEFDSYESSIPNIKKVLSSLYNPEEKSLYCVVEGERGVGKEELVKKIVSILYKNGKILSPDYSPILFQNLMSQLAVSFSVRSPREVMNKRKAGELVDEKTIDCESEVGYFDLQDNKVYVLTGLEEFIKDYNNYNNSKGDFAFSEVRKKQIKHLLDKLGTLKDKKYIIIVAESKHVEELFKIDARIKFIFEESRLIFPSITLDNIYNEYKKKLNEKNSELLNEKENEFKNEFFDFISLNKTYLPFSNYGLARYLANYSNVKGELVLPENIYKKQSIDERLANIIGLEKVKDQVREFEQYMIFSKKAQASGVELLSNNMHMIFTGNPGTGKTTIARIMAKMLFDLGIISEDKVIEVERKDLIAAYIGQTAIKTGEIIEKAMGGVLFIDEAYSLTPNSEKDFGSEAIATLIKAMEDHKGEFVVIFAGYKDEMKTFVDSNPGIASRIGYTFDFDDYDQDELLEIFKIKSKNMKFSLEDGVETRLKTVFEYFSKKKNFGNGRFVDKILQETIMKHSNNYDNSTINILSEKDIPTIEELSGYDKIDINIMQKDLENIVGLENVKEKLKEMQNYVIFTQKAQKHHLTIPLNNNHMIFTGNPGTGKTTIARIIAKMLFNIGVLHENKVIEVERKDLIARYIGQTAPKTGEVIEKAMGGVLFIDEAYTLTPTNGQDFGGEAIATLIKAMEDHKGEFVVIFAGYKDEMRDFIESNPGIASRIGYTFDFEDYNAEELTKIFEIKMKSCGFDLKEDALPKVKTIMQYFCGVENFGNGRFVDRVMQETLLKHSNNISENNLEVITENDIPEVKEIIGVLSNGDDMINPEDITDASIRKTAIHETGHAMLAYLLYDAPDIEKITINVEGRGSLGYVRHKGNIKKFTHSKLELENKIKVLLAGACAEEVFIGYNETGNSSDLEKATGIARRMVTKHGMSDLGLARIDNLSDGMGKVVYDEMNKILDKCHKETIELIKQNKDKMEKAVTYLLEHKEITEEEFLNCVK